MTAQWMDFAVLKEQANFSAVLQHYGIEHRSSHGQVSVRCPFHDDTNPSLSIHMEQKLYQCFACPAKGDILNFVAEMEKVSIPEAARIIADVCSISMNGYKSSDDGHGAKQPKRHTKGKASPDTSGDEDADISKTKNKPLDFTLSLDPSHPYLSERGITPEIIETFGIGYCNSGIMKGRIAVPLHDASGELVGYSGRWASDPVPEGTPKYLLPRGLKKGALLFNFHRVADAKHLVIVEGYWSVFRLHALNVPALALLGRTSSLEQKQLLGHSRAEIITLLLDEDEPGRKAMATLAAELIRYFFVRVPRLPYGESPDTVEKKILLGAVSLH